MFLIEFVGNVIGTILGFIGGLRGLLFGWLPWFYPPTIVPKKAPESPLRALLRRRLPPLAKIQGGGALFFSAVPSLWQPCRLACFLPSPREKIVDIFLLTFCSLLYT